jgi:uroporphyrinogen-III synthase
MQHWLSTRRAPGREGVCSVTAAPSTTAGAGTNSLLPLEGYTVGVTADRRREELRSMLARRGARVLSAPTIRVEPLVGDDDLRGATERCLDAPLNVVIVTTGVGFRGWMDAADGWGLGDALRRHLAGAEVVARGPKARSAIRAAGLVEKWSPPSESLAEIVHELTARDLHGMRIAVQQYGELSDGALSSLGSAGADVIAVTVYRWATPGDTTPVVRLIQATVSGQVDGLVFTSAPAVAGLLGAAQSAGLDDQLLDALRGDTVAACVGVICAQPLVLRDVPVVVPERARLGSLVQAVEEQLPERRARHVVVAGRRLELRGHVAVLDDTAVSMPPAPMAMLRALARNPGAVYTRQELATSLPGDDSSTHAVEMAVTRVRSLLHEPRLVQTVVKRGYRLACDPETSR